MSQTLLESWGALQPFPSHHFVEEYQVTIELSLSEFGEDGRRAGELAKCIVVEESVRRLGDLLDDFDVDLGRKEFEEAEWNRGRSGERRRRIESFVGVSGKGGRIRPGVLLAVVPVFSVTRESILHRSSCFVRIWLKTRAISTHFRSFLPPLRSIRNLALSIDRRTAHHHRNGTA